MKGEFENRLKNVLEEVKGSPDADRPVHRRGAHADRRRWRRRHRRRGQPAQAGAGARRIEDHRRDDLGRVQKVLREGRRARPPLPAGEARRAGSSPTTVTMLRGLRETYEKAHGVVIRDDAHDKPPPRWRTATSPAASTRTRHRPDRYRRRAREGRARGQTARRAARRRAQASRISSAHRPRWSATSDAGGIARSRKNSPR